MLAKYDVSAINTIWDNCDVNETAQFLRFSMDPVTVIFGQGHHGRYALEGNISYYLLAKYDVSAMNTIRNINDFHKIVYFSRILMNPVTLTLGQGHYCIDEIIDIIKYYLMAKFHFSTLNSIQDIVNVKIYVTAVTDFGNSSDGNSSDIFL